MTRTTLIYWFLGWWFRKSTSKLSANRQQTLCCIVRQVKPANRLLTLFDNDNMALNDNDYNVDRPWWSRLRNHYDIDDADEKEDEQASFCGWYFWQLSVSDDAQNCLPTWWSLGFVYTGMRITRMTKMKLIDDNNDANEDNCQDDLPYCWSLGFVSLMITMRWTEMMVMMVGGCS